MADQSLYLMNKNSKQGEILHGGLYSVDLPKNWDLPENSKVKEVLGSKRPKILIKIHCLVQI